MNEPTIQTAGNLAADPELRFTPSGRAVAALRIASNSRRFDTRTNAWVDGNANFFTAEVWGAPAENVVESLERGDRVLVTARVRTDLYTPETGPNAGNEQRRQVLVIDEIGPSLRYATSRPVRSHRPGDAQGDTEPDIQ
jgi:single-strand DNA-binding protein